jgi:predicted RNA-binding protein with PUA-like domain
MAYWLIKSEPSVYSIDHLSRDKTTAWTGVRNYQARNFMRDDMKVGDRVFFYHSSCDEPGIAGIAEVSGAATPDKTQFDKRSEYYDPAATRENPRWVGVELKFVSKASLIPLSALKGQPALRDMRLLARGNRLSITPVSAAEWNYITRLLKAA